MVLKTFSIQEAVYGRFSNFCKQHGMNMSKQVEMFMESITEKDPEAKKEYLEKLDRIRKQKTIHMGSLDNFNERYGIE